MSRLAFLSGVCSGLLLAAPVHSVRGQSESSPPPEYAKALLSLRDSVAAVRLELHTFQRDLPLAGPETVVGRAAALNRRCEGLVAAARAFGPMLGGGPPRAREAADETAEVLERVRRGLTEHCVRGLSPGGVGSRADTLRAWGPYRIAQTERLLAEYDRTARRLARIAGVSLEPREPNR